MFYIISMLAVVLVGFGTIVWRIRNAEQETQNGDAGTPGDNTPDNREGGAYVYTSRKDDERGNGRRMQYKGLQPIKIRSRN